MVNAFAHLGRALWPGSHGGRSKPLRKLIRADVSTRISPTFDGREILFIYVIFFLHLWKTGLDLNHHLDPVQGPAGNWFRETFHSLGRLPASYFSYFSALLMKFATSAFSLCSASTFR